MIGKVNVSSGGNKDIIVTFDNYVSENIITEGDNEMIVLELPVGTKYKFEEHEVEQVVDQYQSSVLVNSPATGYVKYKSGVIMDPPTFGRIWNELPANDDISFVHAFNGGIWLASGWDEIKDSRKGLYYSNDGINWTPTSLTDGDFTNIRYINGVWAAQVLNEDFIFCYSNDGINWTQSEILIVNYENNIYMGLSGDRHLYYSTDYTNWTQSSNLPEGWYDSIFYNNNMWIAYDEYEGWFYSTDGMTWALSNITEGTIYKLLYANNMWVATGKNSVYYSTDGMTWTQGQGTIIKNYYIKYHNNVWVLYNEYYQGMYYSTDGINWTLGVDANIRNCFYNGTGWVACGTGLYYSADGMSWSQSNIITGSFNDCTYINGLWLAYASWGDTVGLYYSTDGITWTKNNTSISNNIDKIIYINDISIAFTSNGLYYSYNSMTWTPTNITENRTSDEIIIASDKIILIGDDVLITE